MTDEELMVSYAVDDNPKAFDELYKRHASKVYGYLKKNCWDNTNVDEIHQNIFLKIHSSRKSYDPKYPFTAWMFTIVKTSMIDYFRKIKSTEKNLDRLKFDMNESSNEENENKESFNLSSTASMDESQKKLLELRYLEGWTFEDIARDLKIKPTAVRQRISRLIKQLRRS